MKKRLYKESEEPMVATIELPQSEIDKWDELTEYGGNFEELGVDPGGLALYETATFPDGVVATLAVTASDDEESGQFYSEVGLYDEQGRELVMPDSADGIGISGDWEFDLDGKQYIVKIVAEGSGETQQVDEDSNKERVLEFEKLSVNVTEDDWDLSDGAEDDGDSEGDEDLKARLNDEVSKPFYFNWDTLAEYEALEQDEDGRWYLDTFVLDELVGDAISERCEFLTNGFDYTWNLVR